MREDQKNKLRELRDKKAKGEDLDTSEQSVLDALESLEESESKMQEKEDKFTETVNGLQSGLDKLRTKFSEQEDTIKDLKEKAGQQKPNESEEADDDDPADDAKAAKSKADALEAKLLKSEDGKKLLQDAWDNMDTAQRNRMGTDEKFRLSVYQFAESKLPEPEVKPPWEASGGQSHEDEDDDIATLFNKDQQQRRAPNERRSQADNNNKDEKPFNGAYKEDYVEDDRTK